MLHPAPTAAQRGATLFPQPIALAATFDPALLEDVASIISDEMRAWSNVVYTWNGTQE